MAEQSEEMRFHDAEGNPEPRMQARPNRFEERLGSAFERVASLLTSAIAAFLVVFVVVALAGVVSEVREPLLHRDFTEAAIHGLDSTFLAIILLELLHTVVSRGRVSEQMQEFLVIGVTATIRHGLEVAASGRTRDQRDLVIDLAITAVAAFILVGALWLVRQSLRADTRESKRGPSDGTPRVAGGA